MYGYDKVPEKALKGSAVSHKTSLEPMERIAPVKWMEADSVDGENYPFAVIQFKYRSAAALRSLFIIPRQPSPLPLEQRPTNQTSSDEVPLLLNKHRVEEDDSPTLKRERTHDRCEDGEIKCHQPQCEKVLRARKVQSSNSHPSPSLPRLVIFTSTSTLRDAFLVEVKVWASRVPSHPVSSPLLSPILYILITLPATMAIIQKTPGLQVQIRVNDRPLREYIDQHTQVAEKIQERYIEATSNAAFEIHTQFTPPFPTNRPVSMIVTIDGKDVDEPFIRAEELHARSGHVSAGPISYNGREWFSQKYQFAALSIKCSDAAPSDDLKRRLEPIGIITCEFYFLENAQKSPERRSIEGKKLEVLDGVDEKAVKGEALSHQATLGVSEPTPGIEYFDAEYADGGEPFATFHFYYRSMSALKDLHIIERTPDPIDLLANDDSVIGQMNREQLETIVRRLRNQEDARLCLKRERSDTPIIVADDADDVGDPDFIETGSNDLRKKRRIEREQKRRQQVPGDEIEVIVLE
ncbi:hypothetical protein DDE83_008388 [Stemphylium lycopersici]|uniref:DUF7918 domain-containing protein n=1 Tax=Stemphylium lycopersici TaxID=183478 RepID=A0A364MTW7_STELY|nr:hypothetical protein DDE83_008388 [Stemphylium lycopersici]